MLLFRRSNFLLIFLNLLWECLFLIDSLLLQFEWGSNLLNDILPFPNWLYWVRVLWSMAPGLIILLLIWFCGDINRLSKRCVLEPGLSFFIKLFSNFEVRSSRAIFLCILHSLDSWLLSLRGGIKMLNPRRADIATTLSWWSSTILFNL